MARTLGLLVAAALLVLAVAPPGASAGQATPYPVDARTTAIVVAATHAPLRVPGSDGNDHLEYDLVVSNAFPAPVTLTAVEVATPDGDPLLRLDGDALVAATQPLLGLTPTAAIPASGTVAVIVDVVVPPDRVPARLTHRITYAYAADAPAAALVGSFVVAGPELSVDPRQPVEIAPPLRGTGWLTFNGCCAPTSVHRSIRVPVDGARLAKPETFAIDWVRLRDGRLFAGDGTRNAQWFDFGAEVTAVADGTVVFVRDGMPEETPGEAPMSVKQPGDYGGNQVIVEIGPGVWAFYAHLQLGSVTVAVGDRVTAGQSIGALGNSGNSTAPHLHFGLLDSPDPLTANSVPMVLDRYILAGAISPDAFEGASTDPAAPDLRPEGTPQPQTGTLPLGLTVADFG